MKKASSAATAILDGIARGDQIGGPTALARIVSESIAACGGLDVSDLTQRYLHWHQTDAFDTGPTFNLVFFPNFHFPPLGWQIVSPNV